MKLVVVLNVQLTNKYCMKHVQICGIRILLFITFIMFMKIFLQFRHL